MKKTQDQLVPFSTRIDKTLKKRVKAHCVKKDISVQEVLDKAFTEYLEKRKD
jgi:hypothetical protein